MPGHAGGQHLCGSVTGPSTSITWSTPRPPKPSTRQLTFPRRGSILNPMVEQHLDRTFTALANPTRRGMLADLMLGEKSIGELAAPHRMSFAGASKHVAVLAQAG